MNNLLQFFDVRFVNQYFIYNFFLNILLVFEFFLICFVLIIFLNFFFLINFFYQIISAKKGPRLFDSILLAVVFPEDNEPVIPILMILSLILKFQLIFINFWIYFIP